MGCERQAHSELAARSVAVAVRGDGAAVHLHERANEREAYA
jgi:hypothetical protein